MRQNFLENLLLLFTSAHTNCQSGFPDDLREFRFPSAKVVESFLLKQKEKILCEPNLKIFN